MSGDIPRAQAKHSRRRLSESTRAVPSQQRSCARRRLFRFLSLLVAFALTQQHAASWRLTRLGGVAAASAASAEAADVRTGGILVHSGTNKSDGGDHYQRALPPSNVVRAAFAFEDSTVTSGSGTGSGTTTATSSSGTDSIFTQGDLILVNPIQSTSIFFALIVCSTALEHLIDHAATQGNAYFRNIVTSIREEMTCIAVAQMVLLLFAITAPISGTAVSVTLVAILTMVFMCILFAIFVVLLATLQSRRGLTWAGFEWSQLNNDALHSPQQRLFKLGRTIFFFRAGLDPEAAETQRAVEAASGDVTSAMPVLFAVYVNFIERRYLACASDFTWLTWIAVVAVVILDGLRSITINSLKLESNSAALAHSVSFVIFVGYGVTAAAAICLIVQRMRIRRYLYEYANAPSMRRCATAAAEPVPVDDAAALRQRRALLKLPTAEGPRLNAGTSGCLFFGSVEGSLGTFKVLVLATLWYTAFFLVCFVSLSFTAAGPAAVVLLLFGLVPFVFTIGYLYPTAVGDMIICCSVGADFDPLLVAGVADGTVDLRDVDADPDIMAAAEVFDSSYKRSTAHGLMDSDRGAMDAGEADVADYAASTGRNGRRPSPFVSRDGDGNDAGGPQHAEVDGEWDLPPGDVTLSGIPTGAPAAPTRIHGIAPGGPAYAATAGQANGTGGYVVLPQRIVFDSNATFSSRY